MGHGINREEPCQGIMPGGRLGNNRRMPGELNSLHPRAGMGKIQGSNRQRPGGQRVVSNNPVPGGHKTLPSSRKAAGAHKVGAKAWVSTNSTRPQVAGTLKV